MKLLSFVLLLHGPIWSFVHLVEEVDARPDPLVSSLSVPLSSPSPAPLTPIPPNLSSMVAFSPGSQEGSENHHQMDPNKKLLIALIVASTALGAIILSLTCLWIYQRRNSLKSHNENPYNSGSKYNSSRMRSNKRAVSLMDYKSLETATENFQESNILGEGGFGCVYKARLDDNVDTEVDLLSKIQHPNVTSLLGYSIHSETRLLVYELMQNGSLETQLHGPSHGSALNWHLRMKIALDTARGLEYLHEHCNPPVIHRDLKSSNILLDSNFNAKLSDFGLAVTNGSQYKKNIKLSGTLGYVAPEYLLDGKLTDKSDVYAFGVVLLELLLGRKHVEKLAPAQCQSIVTWAMPQLTDRLKLPDIVDHVIRNTMDLKHLYQVAAVAVLCVQPEPSYRPLIADVLHSLVPLVPVELGGTLRVPQPEFPVDDTTVPSSC
ncbi:hypothetical protein CsSME_00043847 [Camellia sinensis var. sinensis]